MSEQTESDQIEQLIRRWADAVHAGNMETVLEDHATDIVMFDVPPPEQGVRGIEAYRETWPPFFAYQRDGALFEIDTIDVTAGSDVAYAWALLRCALPEDLADHPARRLRLTVGLRKVGDRWFVAHEHHSFCDREPSEA